MPQAFLPPSLQAKGPFLKSPGNVLGLLYSN